jgi:hypothetical protein
VTIPVVAAIVQDGRGTSAPTARSRPAKAGLRQAAAAGDPDILQKIDDAEALLKSPRKTLET